MNNRVATEQKTTTNNYRLYLDVTGPKACIGLADPQGVFLENEEIEGPRPSEIFHYALYNMMDEYQLGIENTTLVVANGPGSYTGMRLGDGIKQTFKYLNGETRSFHHFLTPMYCGVKKGVFLAEAFKSQFFIYEFDSKNCIGNKMLVSKSEITKYQSKWSENNFPIYVLDQNLGIDGAKISVMDLIRSESTHFFSELDKTKVDLAPYYFRPIEEDFPTPIL